MDIHRRRGGLDVVRKKESSEKRADHRYVSPDTGGKLGNWEIGNGFTGWDDLLVQNRASGKRCAKLVSGR